MPGLEDPCTILIYFPDRSLKASFIISNSFCCLFQMQQQELAQMRQRDANLTALAAIGPRRKRKVDSPGAMLSGTEVRTTFFLYQGCPNPVLGGPNPARLSVLPGMKTSLWGKWDPSWKRCWLGFGPQGTELGAPALYVTLLVPSQIWTTTNTL